MIVQGDCLEVMGAMPAGVVSAIVTDPPYGLGFMGKAWDHGVPGVAYWSEALRVCKPGAHLVAFGGTRTYHRLAVALEDAGWELRDGLAWLYGSGMPKGLNVSKAIDRWRDDRELVYQVTEWVAAARDAAGLSNADIDRAMGLRGMAAHWTKGRGLEHPHVPKLEHMPQLLEVLGGPAVPEAVAELLVELNGRKGTPGEAWFRREVVGSRVLPVSPRASRHAQGLEAHDRATVEYSAPASPEAVAWDGWNTALKPAWEPIILARVPMPWTVARTVLEHGTGALNVGACRVGEAGGTRKAGPPSMKPGRALAGSVSGALNGGGVEAIDAGRWPANVVVDEEAAAIIDAQAGPRAGAVGMTQHRSGGGSVYGTFKASERSTGGHGRRDYGGPSRVFYCAKAGTPERTAHGRVENRHATVKPLELMRWLVRLVAPPAGIVLDPFVGSGTTAVAAELEGVRCLGVELEADHAAWAAERVARAHELVSEEARTHAREAEAGQAGLFD